MHRNLLLQLLKQYSPEDVSEKAFLTEMVQFVQDHPECFERSLRKGHMTSSCWLLNKKGDAALLMHHRKLDIWVQPGGHCDGDSDVLANAVKEAQEESGIEGISPVSKEIFDVDIHLIPENKKDPAHYHYDVRFLLQVTSDEDFVQNRESKELRWIPKDKRQLPTKDPSVLRMFDKWVTLFQKV